MELTTEEMLIKHESKIQELEKIIQYVLDKLNNENLPQQMYTPKDLLIGRITSLYFVKEYEYKDAAWIQHLVVVNFNGREEKFYRDHPRGTDMVMNTGDIISFKVHGTKIKEVKILKEI